MLGAKALSIKMQHFIRVAIGTALLLGVVPCAYSDSKQPLDGVWILEVSHKNGTASYLPQGDTVSLTVRRSSGEIILHPDNPGVAESVIKNFCTKLHGVGNITYDLQKKSGTFHILEVKGDPGQSFCPASEVLGQLAGKEIAEQMKSRNLKFKFQYKLLKNQLILSTTYKNEPVTLTFKAQKGSLKPTLLRKFMR
jgi:hypothetical protein